MKNNLLSRNTKRKEYPANYPYPLTICYDRYNGSYSGALVTAWNLNPIDIPKDISGSDIPCMDFWKERSMFYTVGKGNTPKEAINDLIKQLPNKIEKQLPDDLLELLKTAPIWTKTKARKLKKAIESLPPLTKKDLQNKK
jgi:hypothetical protein